MFPVNRALKSLTMTYFEIGNFRFSDSVGPVCPQNLPDISNEQEVLERMPKGRVEYLKRMLPYLRNQSEDCLYLNIYAPAMGKFLKVNFIL